MRPISACSGQRPANGPTTALALAAARELYPDLLQRSEGTGGGMSTRIQPIDLALPGDLRVMVFMWPDGKTVTVVDPAEFPNGGRSEAVAATLREVQSR